MTAVVNKILAYENPSQTPNGAWQNRVTFIADSATDPAGNFQALSDAVRLNWLPASYTNRHIYWGTDYTVAYPPPNGANMNERSRPRSPIASCCSGSAMPRASAGAAPRSSVLSR